MSKLTQVEASRILFAHAKAVDATRQRALLHYINHSQLDRARKAAEAAFEALVAGMTRDETE
jgi:hypothetical protein